MEKIKIAFFDAKDYDRQSFEQQNADGRFDIRFYDFCFEVCACFIWDQIYFHNIIIAQYHSRCRH